MKAKTTNGISMYLKQSQEFYEALQKDLAGKNNLSKGFNLNPLRLEKSFHLLKDAKDALKMYNLTTANLTETKTVFENWHDDAIREYRKHSALLKGALKHNPQKLLELGIIGQAEEKHSFEWLNNVLAFYLKVLDDQQLIELMANYNLQPTHFEKAKTMVMNSLNAYLAMTNNHPEVKVAISSRDKTFMDLSDDVSELQGLLLILFEKDPDQLKKYNLPIEDDEIGQEISLTMVKDSSITSTLGGKKNNKE